MTVSLRAVYDSLGSDHIYFMRGHLRPPFFPEALGAALGAALGTDFAAGLVLTFCAPPRCVVLAACFGGAFLFAAGLALFFALAAGDFDLLTFCIFEGLFDLRGAADLEAVFLFVDFPAFFEFFLLELDAFLAPVLALVVTAFLPPVDFFDAPLVFALAPLVVAFLAPAFLTDDFAFAFAFPEVDFFGVDVFLVPVFLLPVDFFDTALFFAVALLVEVFLAPAFLFDVFALAEVAFLLVLSCFDPDFDLATFLFEADFAFDVLVPFLAEDLETTPFPFFLDLLDF
jgi:hypothetical protein